MDVYKTLVNKKNKLTEILTDCRPDSNYSKATEKEKFDFYLKQGFINGNTYLPSLKINSSKENFGLYLKFKNHMKTEKEMNLKMANFILLVHQVDLLFLVFLKI